MRSLLAAAAVSIAALCATTAGADARLLVVGNQTPAAYSVFSFGNSGQLTPVTGSPFASATQEPRSLIISPDGTRLYSGHRTVNMVSQHAIAADGALTSLGPDLPFTDSTQSPAISPDGRSLYVSSSTHNANLKRFAVATDGVLTAGGAVQILSNGGGTVVTPDGKFMYVCSSTKGLHGFSLAADGTPTALPAFPQASFGCTAAAITPNGRFLVSTESGFGLRVSSIAADGSVTKIGTDIATGPSPNYLAVAPDGRSAYVLNTGSVGVGANVAVFAIAEDGTASHVGTDQTIGVGGVYANGIAVSPDGRHVVATIATATSNVFVFSTSLSGDLTAVAGSPFSSGADMGGGSPSYQAAFQPNQGPSLGSVTVGGTNRKRSFAASGASDADGSVTGFHWDFGDGTTSLTDSASTNHTYAKSGNYEVRVSAVDNEGCGPADIFDGRQFLCNAATSTSAPVDARAPSLSKLRFSKKSIVRKRSKTKLSFKVSEKATIKLQFQTRKGRKYKTRGTLSCTAKKSGTNKCTISGKIKRRYLPAGRYRVLVTATDKAKNTSSAKKLTLSIR